MAFFDDEGVDVPAGVLGEEGAEVLFGGLGHDEIGLDEDFGVLGFGGEFVRLLDGFSGAAGGDHGAEAALACGGFVGGVPGVRFDFGEEFEGAGGFGGVLGGEEKVAEAHADLSCRRAGEGNPRAVFVPVDFDFDDVGGGGGAEFRVAGGVRGEVDGFDIGAGDVCGGRGGGGAGGGGLAEFDL